MGRTPGKTKLAESIAVQDSLRGINLGITEYKLKPFKKDGIVQRIRLIGKTSEAKTAIQHGQAEKQLRKTCKGLLDVAVVGENMLDLRFTEKQRPGRKANAERPGKAEKKAVKKMTSRKKRTARKVSHGKVVSQGRGRKRLPELRLPPNMARKAHVKAVFDFLNGRLFTDTMRAECVEMIAKFATNTASCKKHEALLAKLKGKIILDPKKNKVLSAAVFKALMKHSIVL